MEDERRKHKRNKLNQLMELLDANTECPLGKLVNISLDGIMVLSPKPIPIDRVWQLKVTLPSESPGSGLFKFGAESLWCDGAPNEGLYWSGFQIIDISNSDMEWINGFAS